MRGSQGPRAFLVVLVLTGAMLAVPASVPAQASDGAALPPIKTASPLKFPGAADDDPATPALPADSDAPLDALRIDTHTSASLLQTDEEVIVPPIGAPSLAGPEHPLASLDFDWTTLTTVADLADFPLLREAPSLKQIVLADAAIVEFEDEPPYARMAARDWLREKLGRRFHARQDWAGPGNEYTPAVLRRRTWEPLGTPRVITIHHAGEVPSGRPAEMIRRIYNGHTTPNGRLDAADVGYHFFVDRDGHIWEGRDLTRMGTHVGSTQNGLNNRGNIGICGLGTFDRERPPKAMVDAVVELTRLLSEYYGRPLGTRGHSEWEGINNFTPRGGTACPGRLDMAVQQAKRAIERDFGLSAGELDRMMAAGDRSARVAAR